MAVHVRRHGLVDPGESEGAPGRVKEHRYTSSAIIQCVLSSLVQPGDSVHIYSDGTEAELAGLTVPGGVQLHLGEPATETFHRLVMADVLVAAKSAFSLSAAILNGNAVYVQPDLRPSEIIDTSCNLRLNLSHWNVLGPGCFGKAGDSEAVAEL